MNKRGVTLDDLYRYEMVANPQFSPTGEWVVYEQTTLNKEAEAYETQLILAAADGREHRVLTTAGSKNYGAVWSKDGKSLAFLSNRDGEVTQAYLLPLNGGEARRVTRFKNGVHSILWTEDSENLVGLTRVKDGESPEIFQASDSAEEIKAAKEKLEKEWQEGPKRYSQLYYKRDGAGLSHQDYNQLVVIQVETGEFTLLTTGPHDVEHFAVSPDNQYVAFVSNRREDKERDPYHGDIYRVPLAGGEMELLCNDTMAYSLSYSPDGQTLAFFGNRKEFESASHVHLYTIPATGGTGENWTPAFPSPLGDVCLSDMHADIRELGPVWLKDGSSIFVQSTWEGRVDLVRFSRDAAGTVSHEIVAGGDREIYSFDVTSDGRWVVMAYATAIHPGRIVVVNTARSTGKTRTFRGVTESICINESLFPEDEIRLDNANEDFFAEVGHVEPVSFEYVSQDGWMNQGWVMKPVSFEAGKRYPVILDIHGGPQMMYGHGYFHELQWFATQGFAVVYVNPRGSMGYGQEHANGVRHHYGEGDAADIMNGLEAAIEKFDFLDGARVAVTGGSYGGFMTNWLVGHTKRFFAAVSQRSISNWFSFYGVSDIGPLFVEAQLGGDIFSNAEALWKMSPLAYAQEVTTPLLLLHSENDLRCPIEQAEQFYTVLKRRGAEVELLRIPNASHGLSRIGKPNLRQARLEAIFGYIHDRLPE